MSTQGRTAKSIKNSAVALIMYAINLILQFYSRKVFLEYLGTEILGLNTTLNNILQFLNLAELGVGAAIGCTLYKPLAKKDYSSINQIVHLQGILYRRIAYIIIVGSILLMILFPIIFKKTDLPIWYAYASFLVLLLNALLGYFINYRQIVLSANQEEYKIQYTYKLSMCIKLLCQIAAMNIFDNAYVCWLILEAAFAFISSFFLNREIRKSAPYIEKLNCSFKSLSSKYPEVITKVKQMFFHKVAGFALLQISPLIIYAYTTLSLVAVYGNYMIIYLGIVTLLSAVFNGINGSIGNLYQTGSKEQVYNVFRELFSLRFFMAILFCLIFYKFTTPFIIIWIGAEYLLPNSTLTLITIMLFISLTRQSIENFINSIGLFRDIWAPITELILNVSLSIFLGHYWGLNGVLIGVIMSLIPIVVVWKPTFLFSKGLMQSVSLYWKDYIINLLIGCVSCGVTLTVSHLISIPSHGLCNLIVNVVLTTFIFCTIYIILLYLIKSPVFGIFSRLTRMF